MEYHLKHPITSGDEQVKVLKFRRPKAKDFRGMDLNKLDMSAFIVMASRLSGLLPTEIDEIDGEDWTNVLEIIANFISPGRKTGTGA